MSRLVVALLIAVLVGACDVKRPPMATPVVAQTPSPVPVTPAALTITGSGWLCGPWWYGCGAVLVIAQPDWTIPADWAPGIDDIRFDGDRRAGSEKPTLITGAREPAPEWIESGDYRLVGILTRQSDVADAPLESTVGCSADVSIPSGTRSISVDITFGNACMIDVSMDTPTLAPSASPRA